jgi:hypothetical protein
MKVQFVCNLGSRDAVPLGLDWTVCLANAVVDVPDEAAKSLIERGIARLPEGEPPPRHWQMPTAAGDSGEPAGGHPGKTGKHHGER